MHACPQQIQVTSYTSYGLITNCQVMESIMREDSTGYWKSKTEFDNKKGEKGDCKKINNKMNINLNEKTKKEASNFYLKPVVQPYAIGAHSKYFWIVTDPEDYNRNLVARRTVYPVE